MHDFLLFALQKEQKKDNIEHFYVPVQIFALLSCHVLLFFSRLVVIFIFLTGGWGQLPRRNQILIQGKWLPAVDKDLADTASLGLGLELKKF